MKLADTIARLPEPLKRELRSHPAVAPALADGRALAEALGSAEWARRWAEAADSRARRLLLRIVRGYAGLPFGEEEAEARFRREPGWTGAEIRVALARLRRDGIVYAVRKAWGERLLYVPSDMVGLWQLLLTQADAASRASASEGRAAAPPAGIAGGEDADETVPRPAPRLPLSLALLRAWADIRRHGLPLTAKGAPAKSRIAKLEAAMGMPSGEPAGLLPAAADPAVPASVALALDLGLRLGWLTREQGRIAAAASPPEGWASLSLPDADAALLDAATSTYAGLEPRLHWAATALRALEPDSWHPVREALRLLADPDEAEREAFDRWLGWLETLGWIERGDGRGEERLRWRIDPTLPALRAAAQDAEAVFGGGEGAFYVQPDLELIVPPEAGFGLRWELEAFAERVSLDAVSVYRITRESCRLASLAGHTEVSLAAWLERASAAPLPEPARRALADWFGRLGRIAIEDVKLLRVDDAELADRLARDPQVGSLLPERLGDRFFAVRPEAERELRRRLEELGYPPAGSPATAGDRAAVSAPAPASASASAAARGPAVPAPAASSRPATPSDGAGWLRLRPTLALYEPDGTLPAAEELFPGIASIPSAWLRQPRAYHPSTRRELVEKAIAWRTALRLKQEEGWLGFVPEALKPAERGWTVTGTVRADGPGALAERDRIEIPADRLAEIMIELPADGGADGFRTNR